MFRFKIKPAILTAIAALAIGATIATPAFATSVDSVTQEITGGTLTASITAASLTSVTYSNVLQTNTGALTLNVSDARGTSQGWNVTVSSTDFIYQVGGPSANPSNIPATGFSVVTPATPVMVAGQAVDGTNGPVAGTGGALSSARQVISSAADYGSGDYTQVLPVSLAIPALSQTGTYVATLTVNVSSGP